MQCVSDYYKYIKDATFRRLKFIVFIKICKVLKSSLVLILRNFIISTFKKGVYNYKISSTWLSLFNNNIQFLPRKKSKKWKRQQEGDIPRREESGDEIDDVLLRSRKPGESSGCIMSAETSNIRRMFIPNTLHDIPSSVRLPRELYCCVCIVKKRQHGKPAILISKSRNALVSVCNMWYYETNFHLVQKFNHSKIY